MFGAGEAQAWRALLSLPGLQPGATPSKKSSMSTWALLVGRQERQRCKCPHVYTWAGNRLCWD